MPLPSYPYPHSAPTLDVPAPQSGQLGVQLQHLNQQAPLVAAQTAHLGAETQNLQSSQAQREEFKKKVGFYPEEMKVIMDTADGIEKSSGRAAAVKWVNGITKGTGLQLSYDPSQDNLYMHSDQLGVIKINKPSDEVKQLLPGIPKADTNVTLDENLMSKDPAIRARAEEVLKLKQKPVEPSTQDKTDEIAIALWNRKQIPPRPENAPVTKAQLGDARALYETTVKTDPTYRALQEKVMQKNLDRPPAQQTVIIQTRDAAGNPVTQVVSKEDALKKTKNEGGYARPEAAMTENRKVAARNSLSMGNELIGLLDDPEIQAKLGPFMGRAASLQQWAGNLPPDLSELAGTIMSWTELQPAVHGMRSSEMAENIEKNLPLKMTPAALKGFVRGFNRTARTVATSGSAKDTIAPVGGSEAMPAAPKVTPGKTIGEKKQYPNGQWAQWDGTGWLAVNQ